MDDILTHKTWEEAEDAAENTLAQKTSKISLNVNAAEFKPNVFAKEFIPSWLPQPAQTPSEPVVEKSESENLADIPVENTPTPPNPAANPAPMAKKETGKKTVSSSTTVSTSTAQITETTETTEQDEHVDAEIIEDLYGKEHLNVVFIGHVDAGKSTMGGNLLFLTGMVDQRTMEKYEREAKDQGRESWYLSWALDTNKEERAKGKTVECGRAYFETEKRRYTILDAPGHKNYVPSMIGGASQADIAVLVISARKGEFETGFERGGQTREHALLVRTLGVSKLIVVINKMDDATVCWSKGRYDECVTKITPFLKGNVQFMPVSGYTGLNLKERVPKEICSWYSGPSLLEYLDNMQALDRKIDAPLMIPIIEKYKASMNPQKEMIFWYDMGTVVVGKVESGKVRKGQMVLIMPNRRNVEVSAVYNEVEEEIKVGICGDNVRLRIRGIEEEDISTGFVVCSTERPVKTATAFEAQLAILEHKNILCAGYSAVLHVHTCVEEVSVAALLHLLDKKTARRSKRPPQYVKKGQKVIARLESVAPICVESYEIFPQLGRFTLRDEGKTIAIGKVTKVVEHE
ncbi:7267_t:CDS:10 [Ambispora leptoticha]|uniref:Eukaryotic peptide chain release factor GTP-binding subunit n=1 Tax=Ambispora leptoticha TaxID=144679 RepID=A0A9N9B5L3_9GLOM|nr:7267_t:CDS:10 [Ambispora leptoticha]